MSLLEERVDPEATISQSRFRKILNTGVSRSGPPREKADGKTKFKRGLKSDLVLSLAVLVSIPLYYIVVSSFKTSVDMALHPLALPDPWMPENYPIALERANMWTGFRNSLILTGFGVLIQVFIGSLASYGMIIQNWVFTTAVGVILLYSAGAIFCYFLMVGYMRGLPRELIEAARIDGAGPFRIYWRIILPLCKPILITVIVSNRISPKRRRLMDALAHRPIRPPRSLSRPKGAQWLPRSPFRSRSATGGWMFAEQSWSSLRLVGAYGTPTSLPARDSSRPRENCPQRSSSQHPSTARGLRCRTGQRSSWSSTSLTVSWRRECLPGQSLLMIAGPRTTGTGRSMRRVSPILCR